MPKDKDRALNPAAQQRKLEKQKALKKGKAQVAAQRTERLATRNPHRLESQIADLHSLKESQGGKLNGRDAKHLEDLERDVGRVKKARDAWGGQAPTFRGGGTGDSGARGGGRGRSTYGGLGKRARHETEEESEETDEEVKNIPWPKDTPPPILRRQHRQQQRGGRGMSANNEPLGTSRTLPERRPDTKLPPKLVLVAPKTTYESKPQVRDLRKEAVQAFVPTAVKRKIDAVRGRGPAGKLLEEEELEILEREGYGKGEVDIGGGQGATVATASGGIGRLGCQNAEMTLDDASRLDSGDSGGALDADAANRLNAEIERFQREIGEARSLGDEYEGLGDGGARDHYSREESGNRGALQAKVEEENDEDM